MSELIAKAKKMVDEFCKTKGVDPATIYNAEKQLWSLQRGSAPVQVMLLSIPVGEKEIREYLQVAAPIIKVPKGKELDFYRKLLELNDVKLGVKLSIQSGTDQVWALAERDLIGMDYAEMETCLEDLGYWADLFDDMLREEFAG
jgi:hypothetical protein